MLTNDFSINYSQYGWTKGIGKLFVFDSLRNLQNFHAIIHPTCPTSRYPVWECRVRNPEPITIMAKYSEDYERFWKSFPHIPSWLDTTETPTGTLAVSSLKLLERVC